MVSTVCSWIGGDNWKHFVGLHVFGICVYVEAGVCVDGGQ